MKRLRTYLALTWLQDAKYCINALCRVLRARSSYLGHKKPVDLLISGTSDIPSVKRFADGDKKDTQQIKSSPRGVQVSQRLRHQKVTTADQEKEIPRISPLNVP